MDVLILLGHASYEDLSDVQVTKDSSITAMERSITHGAWLPQPTGPFNWLECQTSIVNRHIHASTRDLLAGIESG